LSRLAGDPPSAAATPVALGGLSHAHQAHLIAAVHRLTGRPVAAICANESKTALMAADLAAWTQTDIRTLAYREWVFFPAEAISREWEHSRLDTLSALASGIAPVVCAPIDAFLQRTLPPQALKGLSLPLKPGQPLCPESLTQTLTRAGYQRADQVEGVGQYAHRGGIVDFFSPNSLHPIRVDFFGDEIDTLASVDTDSQRRLNALPYALLLPVSEALPQAAPGGIPGLAEAIEELAIGAAEPLAATLRADAERLRETGDLPGPDRYLPLIAPGMRTAFDVLPPGTIIFCCEQASLRHRVDNTLTRLSQDIESLLAGSLLSPELTELCLDFTDFTRRLSRFSTVFLDDIAPGQYPLPPRAVSSLAAKQLPSYAGHLDTAAADIEEYRTAGYAVAMLCADERRAKYMQEALEERGVSALLDFAMAAPPIAGQITLSVGALSAGLEYPSIKLCALSEGQIVLSPRRAHKAGKAGKKDMRAHLASYADLMPGDMVVHEHHGIGRFTGIVKMQIDGATRDYIHISYAGGDTLYVPVTHLHLVSKYIGGGEDSTVKLHRLGGAEWQRARSRAKAAVKDLADGLIQLYAERARMPGHTFPEDSDWQMAFEEAFDYPETDDQLRCADEIKGDMQQPRPMDRLLCGDVGFGKTEVALRAVMKCVLGGRQAALLAPTTVLAQQHHQTALRRFEGFPINIGLCSRFVPPRELKEAQEKLRTGDLDFVIGTHKLLHKGLVFKRLGLLIVDEEQRFGVTHKERLKEMSRQVDVLTLTATPIPRTLSMSLSGIRDMSTLEEPPRGRYPVQTYVLEHDWSLLADAMRREIQRGGQVYYLHNRVETIDKTAVRIADMLPGVTVAAAHGQMEEQSLSHIMRKMSKGSVQVLVCTTIIETGLDIPNVNTLIIEDADRLGLAQLHQIRGRVGRSPRHAFAYMTYRRGKILSEAATKRLTAIREFAAFGSGFKIAMRDLEIRGAGNVLGSEQHGHMMSVGYDMYLKLLEDAVLEAKGEKAPPRPTCTADLAVAASIPESYIPPAGQRMDLYRRIAAIRDAEEASDLTDELIDRFGDPPGSVLTLLQIALLRAEASQVGISEISQRQGRLLFYLTGPDLQKLSALYTHPAYKGCVLFAAGETPHLSLRLSGGDVIREARAFVRVYGASANANDNATAG